MLIYAKSTPSVSLGKWTMHHTEIFYYRIDPHYSLLTLILHINKNPAIAYFCPLLWQVNLKKYWLCWKHCDWRWRLPWMLLMKGRSHKVWRADPSVPVWWLNLTGSAETLESLQRLSLCRCLPYHSLALHSAGMEQPLSALWDPLTFWNVVTGSSASLGNDAVLALEEHTGFFKDGLCWHQAQPMTDLIVWLCKTLTHGSQEYFLELLDVSM